MQGSTQPDGLVELEAERRRLALDVLNGIDGSKKKFDAVEKKITDIRSDRFMRDLAIEEQARRDKEEAAALATEEREKRKADLKLAQAEVNEGLKRLQAAIDQLPPLIAKAIDAEKAVYQLCSELGLSYRWNIKDRIANYVTQVTQDILHYKGGYLAPAFRVPLASGAIRTSGEIEWIACDNCGIQIPKGARHNSCRKNSKPLPRQADSQPASVIKLQHPDFRSNPIVPDDYPTCETCQSSYPANARHNCSMKRRVS